SLVHDTLSVRRPAREPVVHAVIGDHPESLAIRLDQGNLRGWKARSAEVSPHAECNHVSTGRPYRVKCARALAMEERVFPGPVGIHHLDAGVLDTGAVIAVLAVKEFLAIR